MPDFLSDNDVKLMLALKNGDEASFNELLRKYETPLVNFIYRYIGDQNRAEELSQEVFLRIYRHAPKYEPLSKFSTWLFQIAVNLCLDFKKSKHTDPILNSVSITSQKDTDEHKNTELADPLEKSTEQLLEQEEINKTILSAISSLPSNQRLALSLKVYEDKSYEEIAEILDCSVSSVESLIFRARQSLKKQLSNTKK
jgi:RNA polymerase sigma-70 factor (ECF subfamily)